MSPWSSRAAVAAVSLCAACASPQEADEGVAEAGAPIHGGTEVATCGYPTVAMLGSATCTATLIHPEILVYAAHCGTSFSSARFGESAGTGFERAIASCAVHPDYTGEFGAEWDYAICRLVEPLVDLPIVPPIMGCETDVLVPGRPVVVVGFGRETEGGGAGIKREMPGVISSIMFGGTSIAIDNVEQYAGACPGDSGGPTFVELDDGSFRQLGVHHTASSSCDFGFGVTDKRLWMGVPWIESETGLDVTPCHDADGTWSPGPACGGFPMAPGEGGGAWPACRPGPASPASETCGPPFGSGGGGSGGEGAGGPGTGGAGGAPGSGGGPTGGGGDDPSSSGGAPPGSTGTSAPTTSSGGDAGGGAGGEDGGGGSDGEGGAAQDGGAAEDGCSCRATSGGGRGGEAAMALVGIWLARRSRRVGRARRGSDR